MRHTNNKHLFWILFVFSALLLIVYNLWGVLESSEARYAEIGREMLESGDFLHPRLLGILHFHKPPVSYILSSLSQGIFGINSIGARFFLVVAFTIQIILVYKISRILFGAYTKALTAAIIYSSFPLVLISVLNLTTDAFLNTFELIAIYYIIKYFKNKAPGALIWFYFFLSLAFLTKGPVGLIIPFLLFAGCRMIYGKVMIKSKVHHMTGLATFLILSLSWYIYLIIENPEMLDYFLFNHTIERITNASSFERSEPWYYYIVFFLLLFIPWSLMFIKKIFEKGIWKKLSSWRYLIIFWIIIPLILFSLINSKLVLYILPISPGLAILCSWFVDELKPHELKAWTKIHLCIYLIITSGILLLTLTVMDIQLSALMIILPISMILCFIWTNFSRNSFKIHKILIYSLIFSFGLILYSSIFLKNNELMANGTKPLKNFLEKNELTDHQIIVYDRRLPSLSYNLNKEIISVHDGGRSLNRETGFEKDNKWKENLIELRNTNKDSLLVQLLKKESVLFSKNESPDKISWISTKFNAKEKIGDWLIFYNK